MQLDDPSAIEAWDATTQTADYRIRLVRRPRAGLELTASKNVRRGAGFRICRREPFPTEARARQRLRSWLVEVVEGNQL